MAPPRLRWRGNCFFSSWSSAQVIGLRGRKGDGSLAELNVSYREIALDAQGGLDWEAINKGVLKPNTKCVDSGRQ